MTATSRGFSSCKDLPQLDFVTLPLVDKALRRAFRYLPLEKHAHRLSQHICVHEPIDRRQLNPRLKAMFAGYFVVTAHVLPFSFTTKDIVLLSL
jgi:hypothetical protein